MVLRIMKMMMLGLWMLWASFGSVDGFLFEGTPILSRVQGSRVLSPLLEVREDALESGVNSVEELEPDIAGEKIVRLGVGVRQFVTLKPICSSSAIGLLTGCARQFRYLTSAFGAPLGRLFAPAITPEKQPREFLEGMPLPPNLLCCTSAIAFQENLCACDPQTILAFRNLGIFDPLQTMDFADFLYGEQCGARTVLAENCPNGSPFDKTGKYGEGFNLASCSFLACPYWPSH